MKVDLKLTSAGSMIRTQEQKFSARFSSKLELDILEITWMFYLVQIIYLTNCSFITQFCMCSDYLFTDRMLYAWKNYHMFVDLKTIK